MLLFFILGDVIGAGIYALVGEVGGEVGGAIWVAFTVALVLALCTAFAYAELVTKYPHAGAPRSSSTAPTAGPARPTRPGSNRGARSDERQPVAQPTPVMMSLEAPL